MQGQNGRVDPNFAWIAVAVIFVIIYGSLYPFHFRGNLDLIVPLRALIKTWRGPFGRGDFVANVLLYVPVGLFLVQALRSLPQTARIALVVFSGLALSASIELLQFYDEGRVSALADVYANTMGVALGSGASAILFRRPYPWSVGAMDRRPFVILLLFCWLGYELFPYVPAIDLHKYWTAVKPLVLSPMVRPAELYRHTVIWLAIALLVEALFGTARSRVALPLLVLLVLFGRILVVDAVLSAAEVAGGALAALVWCVFLSRLRPRAAVIAALFVGAIVIEALRPFQFVAVARPFGWIPFYSFMHGSVEVNIRSFLEKAFTYGALTWLIARAGCRLRVAAGLGSGLVLCLRLSQMFLPGRSAEITDPIMLLIMAGIMKSSGENPTGVAQSTGKARRDSICVRFYQSLTRNDSVQPVDLIFVLAGRMERKHYGLELYRAGLAPRLVLSVGRFEVSKMRILDAEQDENFRALRDNTLPDERHFFVTMDRAGIRIEKAALLRWNTYGEALGLRQLLNSEKARRIMVISTDVHLCRVALTFDRVFRNMPICFLYCPVPPRFTSLDKDAWWTDPDQRRFVIIEMVKLVGYRVILSAPECAVRRLMRLKE